MEAKKQRRRCLLLSFSGIDGAGKSTQIEALCAKFIDAGLSVRKINFWDGAATLTRFREQAGHALFGGDRGIGTPAAPVSRKDKNVRSAAMTVVRWGLYFLDALSLAVTVRRALRSGAAVVVFDRYIYDEFANLDLRKPANRAYVRLLMRIAPKPDLSFLLDAVPAQARARKPEYPLDFLYTNRDSYLNLSALAGMTVIEPGPPDQAARAILRCASERLPLEAPEWGQAEHGRPALHQ